MAGFPIVILPLLVVGTSVLRARGVIGEYPARVHEQVRGRPRHLVQVRTGPPDPVEVPEQRVAGRRVDSAER